MINLSIGEKLTLLRTRKKLSKKNLALATDMHWTSISKYERNEAVPSMEALKKLALCLDVTCDYLIFDNKELQPEIKDKELQEIIFKIDSLQDSDRNSLKKMILSFVEDKTIKK